MNRKIVFKSTLFVAMLGFVLLFSSCKEEKKIIGKWKVEKMELKELSCSDPLAEALIKWVFAMASSPADTSDFGGVIEFTKDGKEISYTESGNETSTYKMSGSKLTVTDKDGKTTKCDCSFPDKKTMLWIVNVLEQDGIFGDLSDEYKGKITKFVVGMTFAKQ